MKTRNTKPRIRPRKHCLPPVILILAIVATSAADPIPAPSVQFRKVAETGMAAPGTEPGVVFAALTTPSNHNLLIPKMDQAGRVAFTAMLSGPGVDASNFQGMWAEQDGMLQLVARGGQPAPGTGEGVFFLGVPSLEVPFAPQGAGARIAFNAELTGTDVDILNDQGMWSGGPDGVNLVARENSPAPGLPGLSLGLPSGIANAAGHVVFQNDLRGSGVDLTNHKAIYTDRSGTLQLFMREGDPAPFTEPGTVIGGGIPFKAFNFNDNSALAVSLEVEGSAINSFNNQLLYVERNGALELFLREGDPAPGAGPGVTFGGSSIDLSPSILSMNNNERLAFRVRLGGAVSTQSALYSDRTGTIAPIALQGQPAPGANFDYSFFGGAVLNDIDQIAFDVAFPHDDGDIFTPPPFGVFSDVGGPIAPVVSPGDTTSEGELIDDVRIRGFNSVGQMLLGVTIVSPAYRTGFWLRDTDGTLHRIAATGDQFDVAGDGSDLRDVIRVVTGGMNEAGQVAIRLDFAGDSSAHFVASRPCQSLSPDIVQFVAALLSSDPDPATVCSHDGNGDGVLNGLDIQPIVEHLLGP